MFKKNLFNFFEPIALFSLIFLPGILNQLQGNIIINFDNISLLINYIIKFIPSFFIIVYIIELNNNYSFNEFGFKIPNFKTLLKFIPLFLLILFAFNFIVSSLYIIVTKNIINASTNSFIITKTIMLIPAFFVFIMVGYLEELFFRSYLLTYLQKKQVKNIIAILISSTLFSLGHMYQGLFATFNIFILGIIFSLMWFKCKNLHILSLTHASFNFIQLVLMLLT